MTVNACSQTNMGVFAMLPEKNISKWFVIELRGLFATLQHFSVFLQTLHTYSEFLDTILCIVPICIPGLLISKLT